MYTLDTEGHRQTERYDQLDMTKYQIMEANGHGHQVLRALGTEEYWLAVELRNGYCLYPMRLVDDNA